MRRTPWWIAGTLVLQLVACDRESVVTGSVNRAGDQGAIDQADKAALPIEVMIEPSKPSVADNLTAVTNETAATYAWWINDQLLPDETGQTLPRERLRRGDEVRLTVALQNRMAQHHVTVENSPPKAVNVTLDRPLDRVHRGMALAANPEGVDLDGDPITWAFQWIINDSESLGDTSSILGGDRFQRGDRVTVRVTPSDPFTQGEAYTPLPATVSNGPPEFVSHPLAASGSAEYRYLVSARDPDDDRIRYTLVKGPEGMTIDQGSGEITWTLPGRTPGKYPVEIAIDDGHGGHATQHFELDIALEAR